MGCVAVGICKVFGAIDREVIFVYTLNMEFIFCSIWETKINEKEKSAHK